MRALERGRDSKEFFSIRRYHLCVQSLGPLINNADPGRETVHPVVDDELCEETLFEEFRAFIPDTTGYRHDRFDLGPVVPFDESKPAELRERRIGELSGDPAFLIGGNRTIL